MTTFRLAVIVGCIGTNGAGEDTPIILKLGGQITLAIEKMVIKF